MVLFMTLHGLAGVLWQTSSQLLLHDIAGGAQLPSAVRLTATARTLGVLVGPAVGGLIMLLLAADAGVPRNVSPPLRFQFKLRVASTTSLGGKLWT